ncbi:MAG TPA: PHB depolymerase family esterase [Steroidobacteraceae bacterium]|nr:PHB depolymerase family esterase [Steroidobacteraceae bacterium]
MVTRREILPMVASAAGLAAVSEAAPVAPLSEPELKRVAYQSRRTGKEREYFVYLPRGFKQKDRWPVMLFLHGDGERGDAKAELDYVLIHGPLSEAWSQKRDLPFVIISPQLDKFSRGNIPYIRDRTPAQIPKRLAAGAPPRQDERNSRGAPTPEGLPAENDLDGAPLGPPEGWSEMDAEVIAMVDATLRDYKGDAKRVYLTGLSYGGFGSWFFGSKYPQKFAAMAPVVGYGYPAQAAAIAAAKLPVWCFAGGRDPTVKPKFFFAAMNELEKLGGVENRFTIEADLGHFTWVRVYGGEDLYAWFLAHSR